MTLSASKLRENIYKILDEILATGTPVEVERRGRRLRIVPVEPPVRSKLDRVAEHPDYLRCDPDDVVHCDWTTEWNP